MSVHDCASQTLKIIITVMTYHIQQSSLPFPQHSLSFTLPGGVQNTENVCRQRFRIVKIVQVEPYLIADVDYGFSGNTVCLAAAPFVFAAVILTHAGSDADALLFV